MADDRPRWLVELERELCRGTGVVFAVVFGSRIDGEPRPSSDVDVAVKFDDDLPPRERFRRVCSLSGNLQRSDGPFVDVSDVEALPLQVARRAVEGEVLCGDEASFSRHKATIEAEYEERREDLKRRNRAVIDRIASGGLRGS